MVITSLEDLDGMTDVMGLLDEGLRLQNRLGELGGILRQVASLLDKGSPPSPGMAASVIEVSKAFEGWHERAQRILGGSPVEPVLPSVLEALEAHRKALEEAALRQKAMNVLEQVSSLVYRGNEEFLPLSTVQFDALGMIRKFKDMNGLNEVILSLASGSHSYNLLLKLVMDKEMSNDEWTSVYQKVGQETGQDLAVAAARGRVYLPEQ
ncbi:hypothetical protein [uncultured Meiothermus sp.]|jgi:hypothetical protein|uniref:hypothetical protein n=1 Tax=uncultured Meiothermus sp. TaxID=157471 RepID=UPI00262B0BAE|nr:hypothetical protein [uncultured Meiothermus sp.]